jgi:hypothetical protein
VLRDPAVVRCLIENAIDARIAHLGPLSPSKLRERGARGIHDWRAVNASGESTQRRKGFRSDADVAPTDAGSGRSTERCCRHRVDGQFSSPH